MPFIGKPPVVGAYSVLDALTDLQLQTIHYN